MTARREGKGKKRVTQGKKSEGKEGKEKLKQDTEVEENIKKNGRIHKKRNRMGGKENK